MQIFACRGCWQLGWGRGNTGAERKGRRGYAEVAERNTKIVWKRLEAVSMRVTEGKWLEGRMGAGCWVFFASCGFCCSASRGVSCGLGFLMLICLDAEANIAIHHSRAGGNPRLRGIGDSDCQPS